MILPAPSPFSAASGTAGIYLHIPFCKQACVYCNFHFSTSLRYKEEVLQAIMQELVLCRHELEGIPISTIYFGGGTPSLLTASEISRIIDTIGANYTLARLEEVTLEANPDDLDRQYLQALRHTPITRLSIGVQSFRDEDLAYMKRAHNASQADYAIKAAQDAGFENLTIDLIYGTPGLTDKDWLRNLAKVQELDIPHFSAYALTVEDKTALHKAILQKKALAADPGQAAGQFELLMQQAGQMGYDHYEISNLARPGRHAIHNTSYWMGTPYLGIGPSAHSFDGKAVRRWNVANNTLYTRSVLVDHAPAHEQETLTGIQRLNEYIMTSLRTMWGCDLDRIATGWDDTAAGMVADDARQFIDKGWLILHSRKLLLTPAGKLFADRIAGELFITEQ